MSRPPLPPLNRAHFLHLLATEPATLLPPGKSLLSMMARTNLTPQHPAPPQPETILHNKVEEAVHRAFWNEALESLSSPHPATQLHRLKALYADLLDAISPLFPPAHSVLQSLAAPLPPTSSPLHTALALLAEILANLRTRCAPARDADIDILRAAIDEPLPPSDASAPIPKDPPQPPTPTPLAARLVSSLRSLISLASILKDDLTHSILGAMSEAQLSRFVSQQAREEERALVVELWGETGVRALWRGWINGTGDEERGGMETEEGREEDMRRKRRKRWVVRLLQALSIPVPISCDIPSLPTGVNPATLPAVANLSTTEPPSTNTLPPQFFFALPALLHMQNYLQALVIAAALQLVTRLTLSPSTPTPNGTHISRSQTENKTQGSDFMSRIWSLLEPEIDQDVNRIRASRGLPVRRAEDATATTTAPPATRLINLADEVVRARRLLAFSGTHRAPTPPSDILLTTREEDGASARDAVERVLRPRDPVFLLLQERLMSAVGARVGAAAGTSNEGEGEEPEKRRADVPGRMRTGRMGSVGIGAGADAGVYETKPRAGSGPLGVVKGFEDVILVRGIEAVTARLVQSIEWVESVWGDML